MNANEPIDGAGYEKDLWELEIRHRRARRLETIFRVYALIGVLFGIVGLAFFLVGRIQISMGPEERLSLLVAGTGFGLAILSLAVLYWRKLTYAQELERGRYMSSASEFLLQWLKFESVARMKLTAEQAKINTYSIREIVSRLASDGALSAADAAALEEAVRFRGFLVHSGRLVPAEHLTRMTKAIRQITNRLAKPSTERGRIEVELDSPDDA